MTIVDTSRQTDRQREIEKQPVQFHTCLSRKVFVPVGLTICGPAVVINSTAMPLHTQTQTDRHDINTLSLVTSLLVNRTTSNTQRHSPQIQAVYAYLPVDNCNVIHVGLPLQ